MKPNRIGSIASLLFLAVFMSCCASPLDILVDTLTGHTPPVYPVAVLFDPANFVLIPGGEFSMGSPETEVGHKKDETRHQVKVSDFYMSKYEVTVAEFTRFVLANEYHRHVTTYSTTYEPVTVWKNGVSTTEYKYVDHSNTNDDYSWDYGQESEKNNPVHNVRWDEAVDYCKWLSKTTGKQFRLPTEAEWEYACRGGSTTPFNTGVNLTTSQANYYGRYPYSNYLSGDYRGNTVPVDSFAPNAWGLYNMHGNVFEWCHDCYLQAYYDDCKAKGTVNNPDPPNGWLRQLVRVIYGGGTGRVIRGGSYSNAAEVCRSAERSYRDPGESSSDLGFRVVFVP